MKIGIAGPIATDNVSCFLGSADAAALPQGYYGAPLLGTLIGALLDRGHEVVAFTTSSELESTAKPVVAEGDRFRIHYCPARRRAFRHEHGHWGRAMDGFRLERTALSHAMKDDAPDIVHAHWTYEFALAAVDSGVPHLITCHDAPQVVLRYMPDPYRLVRYFMARSVFARARNLTAVSPYLRDKVARYARCPIAVVPNPLPPVLTNGPLPLRDFDPERPRIAMIINGWGKLKNPVPAFRAFARLRETLSEATLVVMGTDFGPGERAAQWAGESGIADGIVFLGASPYSAVLSELAKADLLLHPSLEETFAMSVAEAMALGAPVIGGELSGAVPWVIGDGGATCNISNPEAICLAILGLLQNRDTHAFRAERATAAARERFRADRIAVLFEAAYEQAINEKGADGRKHAWSDVPVGTPGNAGKG